MNYFLIIAYFNFASPSISAVALWQEFRVWMVGPELSVLSLWVPIFVVFAIGVTLWSKACSSSVCPTLPVIFIALTIASIILWLHVVATIPHHWVLGVVPPVPPHITDRIVSCEHNWRQSHDYKVGTDDVFSLFEEVSVDAQFYKFSNALDHPNA